MVENVDNSNILPEMQIDFVNTPKNDPLLLGNYFKQFQCFVCGFINNVKSFFTVRCNEHSRIACRNDFLSQIPISWSHLQKIYNSQTSCH